MGAPAPPGPRDYRPRLEAFLRAAAIPDSAASAAELTKRYGTLSELLSAERVVVADYAGTAVAEALAGARALITCALEEELRDRQPIRGQREAARFLKGLIGFRCDELLIVLFLDVRRCLIDYETIAIGGADSVGFDVRRILLRAIGRGASGIIVAHNHPSGDACPSQSDINATRRLADVARTFGITLHDHLVIAGSHVRSAMPGSG